MNKLALALLLLAAGACSAFAQTVNIATWTFETSIPATAGPFAAEIGSGFASGLHAGASTYSSPAGNGSVHSFSSNTWAIGDYYQFQVSTSALSGIQVSWDQAGSATGPRDFSLQYSVNGSSFTSALNYSVLLSTWSPGSSTALTSYNFDFSSISALNNQATVFFRLADVNTTSINGGTVAAAGTDRVDNFKVTAIPEPSSYAILLGFGSFAFVITRRRIARKA